MCTAHAVDAAQLSEAARRQASSQPSYLQTLLGGPLLGGHSNLSAFNTGPSSTQPSTDAWVSTFMHQLAGWDHLHDTSQTDTSLDLLQTGHCAERVRALPARPPPEEPGNRSRRQQWARHSKRRRSGALNGRWEWSSCSAVSSKWCQGTAPVSCWTSAAAHGPSWLLAIVNPMKNFFR